MYVSNQIWDGEDEFLSSVLFREFLYGSAKLHSENFRVLQADRIFL